MRIYENWAKGGNFAIGSLQKVIGPLNLTPVWDLVTIFNACYKQSTLLTQELEHWDYLLKI